MSRPRRSEQTREALIEAGIEQLSLYGYHGTGIKQILDAVQVPKGSFYNFFASKEAFVAELIQSYSKNMFDQVDAFMEGEGKTLSPRQQLESIMQYSLFKFAKSNCQKACLIGSMGAEVAAESEACSAELDKSMVKYMAFLAGIFANAQAQGSITTALSSEQLANLYWATWEGALIKMKMQQDVEPVKGIMISLLDTLFTE